VHWDRSETHIYPPRHGSFSFRVRSKHSENHIRPCSYFHMFFFAEGKPCNADPIVLNDYSRGVTCGVVNGKTILRAPFGVSRYVVGDIEYGKCFWFYEVGLALQGCHTPFQRTATSENELFPGVVIFSPETRRSALKCHERTKR